MVLRRLVAAAAVCWATHASAESPPFGTYGVAVASRSRQADVQLSDDKSRKYADQLESGAGQKVNFAGHFVLAVWGCGASCVMGAAIDATTGVVSWLPFTVCCWSRDVTEPLEFRADSRLLVVHGSRNEEGSGTHDYLFNGHTFSLLPAKG